MTTRARRPRFGPRTLYPDKVRVPVSIEMTAAIHAQVAAACARLGISRPDLVGLLIDRYAGDVELTPRERQLIAPRRS